MRAGTRARQADMSIGNDSFPYRPPCDGYYRAPRKAVGSCYQHKRASERGIPVMNNVTEKIGGGAVTAGTGCDSLAETGCEGGTMIDRNCYVAAVAPTGVATDGSAYAEGVNTLTLSAGWSGTIEAGFSFTIEGDATIYTAVTTAVAEGVLGISPVLVVPIEESDDGTSLTVSATHDYSLCHKQGWKNVRARKSWHGTWGFEATPAGLGCLDGEGDPICSDVTTKYVRVRRTCAGTFTAADVVNPPNTFTYALSQVQQTSVDKTTGVITMDDWEYSWTPEDGGESGDPTNGVLLQVGFGGFLRCGKFNEANFDQGVMPDPSGWPGEGANIGYTAGFNDYGLVGGWFMSALDFGDTSVSFTLTCHEPDETHSPAFWGSVTVTITLSLSYTYAEVYATAVGLLSEWDMGDDVVYPWRLDSQCGVAPLVSYREVFAPVSPDIGLACPLEAECDYIDSNAAVCSEDVIGGPLPKWFVFNTTGQDASFYQCEFPSSVNPSNPQWNPYTLIPNSTFWGSGFPDGAFVVMQSGVLYAQKWAGIKDSTPSMNFFRPCGADRSSYATAWPICGHVGVSGTSESGGTVTVDLVESADYLRAVDYVAFAKYDADYKRTLTDGDVEVASVGASQFTYRGSLPDASATHVVSYAHGTATAAPHYVWNNDTAKGDFVWLEWTTVTNSDCTETMTPLCVPGCILRTPCSPSVMCISPNQDGFNNAQFLEFSAGGPNTVWQAIGVPHNADPLGGTDRVEARCAVPTWEDPDGNAAPPLPVVEGVGLPCSSGDCASPPTNDTCYSGEDWDWV